MPDMLIKMSFDFMGPNPLGNQKPVFFRWIPTREDRLCMRIKDTDNEFCIWFDGVSQIQNQKETFVADKLSGKLKIKDVHSRLVKRVERSRSGPIEYAAFGKKVINKIIYPTVSNFLDILRINYGQYWVKNLLPWDSREMTLGQYCKTLDMRWSINDSDWFEFVPVKSIFASITFTTVGEAFYREFLLKEDWSQIAELIHKDYQPTIGATLLNRAHFLNIHGDLRYSFIEGISALELALKEFIQSKISSNESITKALNEFWNMGLESKVVSIGLAAGGISPSDMENTIKAIKIRNKIMHEGWEPGDLHSSDLVIRGLLRTVSALLQTAKFKFPQNPVK